MIIIPPDLQKDIAEFCDMATVHMDKYPLAGSRGYDPEPIKNLRELADRWRSLSDDERASMHNGTALVGMPH